MRLDVHFHFNAGQLDRIESTLSTILKGMNMANAALDRLTQEVADTKGAAQSAIALLNGLGQYIRDNVSDQAALNALADDLDAGQAEIAAAVAANPLPGTPPAGGGPV